MRDGAIAPTSGLLDLGGSAGRRGSHPLPGWIERARSNQEEATVNAAIKFLEEAAKTMTRGRPSAMLAPKKFRTLAEWETASPDVAGLLRKLYQGPGADVAFAATLNGVLTAGSPLFTMSKAALEFALA
jgi:hypothetical protein